MLKNEFQGGPAFEIFSSQGSAQSLQHWKIHNKAFVKRQFEKDLKGFCHSCENLGKLSFPKDERQQAYLVQPFIVFQIYCATGQPLSIELCISDLSNNHRRFFFSTAHREIKTTALHCGIPLAIVKRSMISDNYKGHAFRSLDGITILGTFRLRRIFTLKQQPPDTTGDDFEEPLRFDLRNIETLPKSLDFPLGVTHLTQVINMHRIQYALAEQQTTHAYDPDLYTDGEELLGWSHKSDAGREGPSETRGMPDLHAPGISRVALAQGAGDAGNGSEALERDTPSPAERLQREIDAFLRKSSVVNAQLVESPHGFEPLHSSSAALVFQPQVDDIERDLEVVAALNPRAIPIESVAHFAKAARAEAAQQRQTFAIYDEFGARQELRLGSPKRENGGQKDNYRTNQSIDTAQRAESNEVAGENEAFEDRVDARNAEDDFDETLELEYDEELRCYCDPLTGKLYDIET
nr:hypothetical protein HK105_000938 [Polyrhizophydium stewartii]